MSATWEDKCGQCGAVLNSEKVFHFHPLLFLPYEEGDSMLLGKKISTELGPSVEYRAPWDYPINWGD